MKRLNLGLSRIHCRVVIRFWRTTYAALHLTSCPAQISRLWRTVNIVHTGHL